MVILSILVAQSISSVVVWLMAMSALDTAEDPKSPQDNPDNLGSCLSEEDELMQTIKKEPEYSDDEKITVHISTVIPDGTQETTGALESRHNDNETFEYDNKEEMGEKPFICRHCGKYFTQEFSIKLLSYKTPYSGNLCDGCFKKTDLYKQMHAGKKQLSCEYCGKIFSKRGSLNVHRRNHTGEKPYCCQYCDKCFTSHRYLKVHTRTHTGEKPCKCKICGKGFIHRSNLNRHELQHSGEKPFSCEFCGKSFTHSTNLNRHRNLHTGDKMYSCEVCGKIFSRSCHVKRHAIVHIRQERPVEYLMNYKKI